MPKHSPLSQHELDEILDVTNEIAEAVKTIQKLTPHRNLALAITKLQEAGFWLEDRTDRS